MKYITRLITSKDDLREYLEADRKALGLNNKRPKLFQFVCVHTVGFKLRF